jgi:hypothetical protein
MWVSLENKSAFTKTLTQKRLSSLYQSKIQAVIAEQVLEYLYPKHAP